jgi:CHAT domain-containing protein
VLEFWKLNTELVSIAASDRQLELAQAFLAAGSRAVCTTLTEVDDSASVLLVTRFYQNLLGKRPGLYKPLPRAQALSEAKAWLRGLSLQEALRTIATVSGGTAFKHSPADSQRKDERPFAHPRYWAIFLLLGDPN